MKTNQLINVLNFSQYCIAGTDSGFRGEGGMMRQARMYGCTCPDMGHRGLGQSPSRFATFARLKSQKQHSYHRKKTRGIILESLCDITYK